MKTLKWKVIEKLKSKDWLVSYFTLELEEQLNFEPGQFVMLSNWKFKKPYSLASSAFNNERVSFYVKKVSESWFSKFLVEDLKINDVLELQGPFGKMTLNWAESYIFVSIWSWFAPILSMIKTLKDKGFNWKVYNFFGERYVSSLIDQILAEFENTNFLQTFIAISRDDVEEIQTKYKNIKFFRWHVQDIIKSFDLGKTPNLRVYICWKPQMVDDVIKLLEEKWIDINQIEYEKY